MSKDELSQALAAGLAIPLKEMSGNQNKDKRTRAIQLGAKFDSKTTNWVFPSQAVMMIFEREYPRSNGKKAEARPSLPEVQPPIKAERAELPTAVIPPPVAPPIVEPAVEPVQETADPMPELDLSTLKLKPCRFVVVRTKIYSPNVRKEISRTKSTEGEKYGVEATTVRLISEHTIINPVEYEEASKIRGNIGSSLRKFGTRVVDGLYTIPLDVEDEWDECRRELKAGAAEFNKKSTHHKLVVDAVKLQAMTGEEELMARKVTYEVQRLFDEMKVALDAYDVDAIRSAAVELKYKAQTLQEGNTRSLMDAAVANAREVASQIAKEVKDKGDLVAVVKKQLRTSAIDSARMMFLKMAVPEEIGDAKIGAARFVGLMPVAAIDPEDIVDEGGEESPAMASARFNGLTPIAPQS